MGMVAERVFAWVGIVRELCTVRNSRKSLPEKQQLGNNGRALHPVQKIQLKGLREQEEQKDALDRATFGIQCSVGGRLLRCRLSRCSLNSGSKEDDQTTQCEWKARVGPNNQHAQASPCP